MTDNQGKELVIGKGNKKRTILMHGNNLDERLIVQEAPSKELGVQNIKKMNMKLKAQTSLVAERACRKLEEALGIGSPYVNFSTAASSTTVNESFTLDRLTNAINMLKAQDVVSQKYLISLLASIGFNVIVNEYINEPMIFLPEEYKQAMQATKEKE